MRYDDVIDIKRKEWAEVNNPIIRSNLQTVTKNQKESHLGNAACIFLVKHHCTCETFSNDFKSSRTNRFINVRINQLVGFVNRHTTTIQRNRRAQMAAY